MARWRWYCAVVLVSGLWLVRVASAADQVALSAEGTLTSVDLSQQDPTIILRRSTGNPLVLRLGRFGEWGSLKVGTEVKLRYTGYEGAYTVESMQITRPVHAAASASPVASTAPSLSPTTAVEQPPEPSQAVGASQKDDTAQPSTADPQHEQATIDTHEPQPKKKKP